jgi:hypothetical protein
MVATTVLDLASAVHSILPSTAGRLVILHMGMIRSTVHTPTGALVVATARSIRLFTTTTMVAVAILVVRFISTTIT